MIDRRDLEVVRLLGAMDAKLGAILEEMRAGIDKGRAWGLEFNVANVGQYEIKTLDVPLKGLRIINLGVGDVYYRLPPDSAVETLPAFSNVAYSYNRPVIKAVSFAVVTPGTTPRILLKGSY